MHGLIDIETTPKNIAGHLQLANRSGGMRRHMMSAESVNEIFPILIRVRSRFQRISSGRQTGLLECALRRLARDASLAPDLCKCPGWVRLP